MTLEIILVATDFSGPSRAALDYARALAQTFGARLDVVHVVDEMTALNGPFPGHELDLARLQTELEDEAREKLEALFDRAARDAGSRAIVLRSPRPASAILAYAASAAVDLIVLATHGHGGFVDLFLGTVAQQVVRTAGCPVLTVREPAPE